MTAKRVVRRSCGVAAALVAVLLLGAAPASAQLTDDEILGDVDLDFEAGEYDPVIDDWVLEAVLVSGDFDDGEEFVVELYDDRGAIVWSGSGVFDAPVTRLALDRSVGIGDVAAAAAGQLEDVPVTQASLPPSSAAPSTAEVTTTTEVAATTTQAPTTTEPEPTTTPTTGPGVEIISATAGGGSGGGTVTVSVILAVIVLALVFRLPMFAGTQPRWRR